MHPYYSIDLSKKSYFYFVIGLLFLGLLAYFAGVITGVAISTRNPNDRTVAKTNGGPELPDGSVQVTGNAVPMPDTNRVAPDEQERYTIQVGAFLNEGNAEVLLDSFKNRSYDAHRFQMADETGRVWYTVRLGVYPDFNTASQAADSISTTENMPTSIRPVDKL